MSDITLVFGLLFILGLGLPGMLTTWWLLFPQMVERSRQRLAGTPGRTFGMGALSVLVMAVPIVFLISLPLGPAKFLGFSAIFFILTFATLGAAGLAAELAARMGRFSKADTPGITSFVRSALALELAVVVPILGWFVLLPFAIIFSLGAAVFALLKWVPKATSLASPPAELPSNPQAV